MRSNGKNIEGENTVSLRFNGKFNKIITLILGGILILIVLMPTKGKTGNVSDISTEETAVDYDEFNFYADYYENKLKNILEDSYGDGTMQVMVHITDITQESSMYGEEKNSMAVDGVLVVADVDSEQAVADITYAVCALFDLPAHKVAVMIKN